MEKVFTVLEIVLPIFVTIFLGIYARKKNKVTEEQNQGLQQFIMTFCVPCVLFNSCLTCNMGMESITSMGLVFPIVLLSSLWSFKNRKKKYPYHNLPMLFSAKETGMLGIPLFITLFGADQAYRMGVLDMTQALIAIPVIAILTSDTGENPSIGYIAKKVFTSPLLLMSLLGLTLNLTGAIDVLNVWGIGGVMTEVTGFLAQPVSAVILFCVGYNFVLGEENRKQIFKICSLHLGMFAGFCVVMQMILFLVPAVEPETRWAIILYCTLPGSYFAASMGKSKEENGIASSVCSILTVITLVIFCLIAAVVA